MSTLFALLRVFALCYTLVRAESNWNTNVRVLVTERLDPIVNPNGVASHMHTIVGGSAFGAAYNHADSMKSACSSFPISADKSNYWHPSSYWINNNGTSFTPMPLFERIYYVREKNSPNDPVQPFPEGLRMITGNPNNKSPNDVAFSYMCRVSAEFNGPGDLTSSDWNFNRDCPRGVLVIHNFPPCWDGVNLYKSDQSHMAYPAYGAFYGSCPSSHPIRLPGIRFESLIMTYRWAPGETVAGKLVWANGDTTGYGAHADFTNGWDTAILGKALNDPVCGADDDMTFQECPVFQPLIADGACSPEKGVLTEGTYTEMVPIKQLPGCNPLWSTGPKPGCTTPPPTPDVTRFQGTNGPLVAAVPAVTPLPTTPGWKEIACIGDSDNMLSNQIRYYDNNLTQSTCLDSCLRSGYSYASVGKAWGKSWTCDCGTGLDPAARVYTGMCNLTCPADAAQACGGNAAHSVFVGPTGTQVLGNFSTSYGCYANPATGKVGLEQMSSYNFTQWSTMTLELCGQACADRGLDWGGIRSGGICFCGSKENYKLGDGNYVNEALCTSKCAADPTETCGYWGGLSLFNVSASGFTKTVMNKAPGYVQCYQDWPRTSLTGEQFWVGDLSPEKCQFGCRDLGYSLASVFQGNMCLCGNKLNNGDVLPNSLCSSKCPDSASNYTCGGSGSGELYETSAVTAQVAAFNAKRSPGWLGCYANSANNVTADITVSESGMSTTRCISACNELGYPWAGIMNREQCRCSKTDPRKNTKAVAANNFCSITCNGDSTQQCGGWGYVDLYNNPTLPTSTNTTSSVVPSLPGYQGCFNGTFAAPVYKFSSSAMTVDMCTKSCKELGQPLSAVTMSSCACGGAWTGGVRLTSISCGNNCGGNANQKCGGWPGQASVYSSSAGVDSPPPSQGYMGCWQETSPKSLTGYGVWLDSQSVDSCQAICSAKGYALAGLTNTKQCNCGNVMSSNSTQVPSQNCQVPCPGNSAQMCGQWNTVALYTSSGDAPVISASVSASMVSSSNKSLSSSLAVSNTLSGSISASKSASLSASAAATSSISAVRASSSSILSIAPSAIASSSTSTVKSSSTSTSTLIASSSASSKLASASISGSSSAVVPGASSSAASCISDLATLTGAKYSSSYLTQDTCVFWCKGKSFAFAGMSGNTCLCGNTKPSVAASTCSTKCTGNASQLCGGSGVATLLSTSITGLADPYSTADQTGYQGCWVDSNTRLMGSLAFSNANLTRTSCRSGCQQRGFRFAGMQYATQCFCSNALDSTSNNYRVADSECSSKCGGEDAKCGGSWRLSVFSASGVSASAPASASAPVSASASTLTSTSKLSSSATSIFASGSKSSGAVGSSTASSSTIASSPSSTAKSSTALISSTSKASSLSSSSASIAASSSSGALSAALSSAVSASPAKAVSSSVSASTSSAAVSPSTTSILAAPAASPSASSSLLSDYLGCYVDQASPRFLGNYTTTKSDMTTETCRKICTIDRTFTHYATSYGTQCYCGTQLPATAKRVAEADCKYACGGEKTAMCGGNWRVSVYGPLGSGALVGPAPTRRGREGRRGYRRA